MSDSGGNFQPGKSQNDGTLSENPKREKVRKKEEKAGRKKEREKGDKDRELDGSSASFT